MQALAPHFLLLTDSSGGGCPSPEWRFILQPTGAGERIVASDFESGADGTRLALLAVVRGLEALDGPSRVTLLVANRFVRRGIRRDLAHWRERSWRWERFGELVAIRDLDLWQRIDRALGFHRVECFAWSADEHEADAAAADHGRLSDHADGRDGEVAKRALRTYPQRRQGVRAGKQFTQWGQELFDSLTALGGAALSRTA
jgi:ribonuclease HI